MTRDDAYLLDMLIAARRGVSFVAGVDEPSFFASELHQWAVAKQIEIVGEAASCISRERRDALPEIPWPQIIGMRHRLVHDYRNVNVVRVWETARDDLPSLISQLETIVPEEPEEDSDT